MRIHLLIALAVIVLMSDCSPQPPVDGTLVNPVGTVRAGNSSDSRLPLNASPTGIPNSVAQTQIWEDSCIDVSANPAGEAKLNGTIALMDWTRGMLLLRSGKEIHIPETVTEDNRVTTATVSPHGKYILYQQFSGGDVNLTLGKADGSVYKGFLTESSWLFYYQWISDELIRIPTLGDNTTERLLALDLETGKYQELRTDLPNLADGSLVNWGIDDKAIEMLTTRGTNIIYDPSMARAVYPANGHLVALYDVENNKVLASIPLKDWGNLPTWSPDGNFLAIESRFDSASDKGGDDFLLVPQDGPEFVRLTSLASLYPGETLGAYSWSPDSQHLAFWFEGDRENATEAANPYSLALLDINTGKVTNVCISGIGVPTSIVVSPSPSFLAHIVQSAKPVWSPDSTRILVTQLNSDKTNYNVILVDVVHRTAYKIAENIDPVGWMTK